jgi:hypothetical protein
MLDLLNKSAKERAKLKGQAIAAVGPCQKTTNGIKVQIISLEPMEDGVVAFVKAWKNGKPLGFGKDGSVETERMIVHNPPILIDSPLGDIVREWEEEDMDGKKVKKSRKLKEDPKAAILEVLTHNVQLVGKEGTEIIEGRVGNTTSTFYPAAGATNGNDAGLEYWENNAWSSGYGASSASRSSDSPRNGLHDDVASGSVAQLWNSGSNWLFMRSAWFINTSAIGDGEVTGATFTLTGTRYQNAENVRLHKHASTNTQIARADYNRTLFGDAVATDISSHSWGTTDTAVSITITDLTAINGGGYTRLGMRMISDVNNSAPASPRGVTAYYADESGTTKDPKLVVEHAAAAAANTGAFFALF